MLRSLSLPETFTCSRDMNTELPSAEKPLLPPSPAPICLTPASFIPGGREAKEPVALKGRESPRSPGPEALRSRELARRWGWRPASLEQATTGRVFCCCPHPRTPRHCDGSQDPRPKRVFFLSFMASGQFFTVLMVSGFVLRNNKHFHIIFTFMIKLSARESDPSLVTRGVWSRLAPTCLVTGLCAGAVGLGWSGRKNWGREEGRPVLSPSSPRAGPG